jgi:AcrR family transcriptional regulator
MRVMKKTVIPSAKQNNPTRSDGIEARQRLLDCATQLFAEHGFTKTSTREIARLANVNISAISYYFGDKEKLFRAVFNNPQFNPNIDPAFFEQTDLSLQSGIEMLIHTFTDTFKHGEQAQHCLKLHLREMLEPTGLWREEIDVMIQPAHLALTQFLCRHLGVKKADDDMHRLAFAIAGLACSLMVSGDVIQHVRPNLINQHKAIDTYAQRMVEYALAMCDAEKKRRN